VRGHNRLTSIGRAHLRHDQGDPAAVSRDSCALWMRALCVARDLLSLPQSRGGFALSCSGGLAMIWTIFCILLVLWLFGLVSSYTFGGFIHVLLVLAVIMLVFQLVSGRRV
jgi:hypothetical protein